MAGVRMVVGIGPGALRAAAARAAGGEAVLLLQEGPGAAGLACPDLPEGTGSMRLDPADRAVVEGALGPLVDAPGGEVAVAFGGSVLRLPLRPPDVRRLLPSDALLPAARGWARARLRNAVAEQMGGGAEERTHRDWVVRRMGAVAWHHAYRSYAERRWGAPSEALAASVARLHHFEAPRDPRVLVAPGGGAAEAFAFAERRIRAAGGEIRAGVRVDRIEVAGGTARAVVLGGEEEVPVAPPLWVAAPPAEVARWLGSALPPELLADARALPFATAARVALRGPTGALPRDVHVLDEGAPFWRVVCPYGVEGTAVFHSTHPGLPPVPGDLAAATAAAADRLGIGRFEVEGARVEILPAAEPVWIAGAFPPLRRLLLAWQDLGLLAVGRAGLFADLDPAAEIAAAADLCGAKAPDLLETWRRRVAPPAKQADFGARITRFVVG